MHSVRRAAHRAASHASQHEHGTVMNYNPFARTRSRNNGELDAETAANEISSDQSHERPTRADTAPATLETPSNMPTFTSPFSGPDDSRKHVPQEADHLPMRPGIETIKKRQKIKSFLKEDKAQNSTLNLGDLEPEERRIQRKKLSLRRRIPVGAQIGFLLFYNYIATILLPCIPAGFAVNYIHTNAVAVFCINFAAIIPSATALSAALNDLSIRSGDKVSALLNQTFGNTVQLILSILLLKSHQVSVLKLSLLGTILSNLLLTTGASFLLGGIYRMEQFFNVTVAQMVSMLLLLAVASLIIPSAARLLTNTTPEGVLAQSRGISVVVLISYLLWLLFTLKSHRSQFEAPSQKVAKRPSRRLPEGAASRSIVAVGAGTAAASGGSVNFRSVFAAVEGDNDSDEEPFEECSLSLPGAIVTLIVSVVLVAFNTQFATDSIQALLQRRKVSQTFLSLIILPLLSNDPMAVNMAMQDKMDISLSLALERCMQTCLMVVPLTVLLAWCMGVNEMDLDFDGFSIATLFVSIIIVTYVVQEGKSNWLTGALLIKVFVITALAAFYIP
ncbi:hypothetical protein HBI64_013270 [Parastagonospora nodorum]|nr:hypothetical protein HBI64_013270 [Parastagonospora nodorum]KAH6420477.1 hypothetical protein HBI59_235110 [Parastagonospora nodorum]